MPPVIGAVILAALGSSAAAAGTFTILGVTISWASVIGTAVLGAASFLIGDLLMPSVPKQDGQLTLQQPIPYRRRIYGRAKMSGYFVFWSSANGTLYQLLALASHEIDAFEEYWITDRQVSIDGSGFVTGVINPPGADPDQFTFGGHTHVRIITSRGESAKAANAVLTANFPSLWTSDYIGVGICDLLIVQFGVLQKNFQRIYPGGQQTVRTLARWAKIYDPRDGTQSQNTPSTWKWSDNAVCVVLDYLTHSDGWRISKDIFLTGLGGAVTLAAMDKSDELVNLKSGGTEARYRIWGFYDFNEEPRAVLARMLAAFAGWLQPMPDGTVGIHVGEWIEPTFTITDNMILGFDITHFVGEFDAVNEVRATFIDPNNDYQENESTPWDDDADIALRGYIKSTTIDARHCPSYTQTRRMQKVAMYEASPEFAITLTCDRSVLEGRNQRFLNLAMGQLGIVASFRVTAFAANMQTGIVTVGLATFVSAAFDWDPDTEEGDPPPVPPDSSSVGTVETPTGFTVNVETKTVSGGNVGPIMAMSCNPPVRTDLHAKFEYQIDGDTGWTVASDGNDDFATDTPILAEGTYNARVCFVTPSGVQSEFAEIDGIVVSVAVAAPGAPTNLLLNIGSPSSVVDVTFRAPNSANFDHARVYRGATNVFGSATDISGPIYGSPNQPMSYDDSPSSGTWYYWATAESVSDNASSPDGPATVTV